MKCFDQKFFMNLCIYLMLLINPFILIIYKLNKFLAIVPSLSWVPTTYRSGTLQCEKCPNTDQKNLRSWTLFTQWSYCTPAEIVLVLFIRISSITKSAAAWYLDNAVYINKNKQPGRLGIVFVIRSFFSIILLTMF